MELFKRDWFERTGKENIKNPHGFNTFELVNGDKVMFYSANSRSNLTQLRGFTIDKLEYYDDLKANEYFWDAVDDCRMLMRPVKA